MRTGDAELKGQKFAQSYVPQRELLKAFLDYTATSTGVTREVVWQGIKQGYFSGLNLDSTELGALYSDLALDSFMRELKTLKKEKLIPGVISNLNLQLDSAHMPEDLVPQVRTAVENLNVSTKAMELA